MWHSLFAYIHYLSVSKSKFGIHSPFVYDFVTKALESPLPLEHSLKLKDFRNDLLRDSTVIEVLDFGVGSKVFNSNQRKISDIAKYAGISKTKAKLLQKIVYYFKPTSILELGTSLGISSAAMCIAAPSAKIISVEACPQTAAKAALNIQKHQLENITIEIDEFSNILPKIFQNNTFDLIFFDGNHKKEATINYFEASLKSTHNDTLLIFDDIHWSIGMEKAWKYIKAHPKITLSIDLFHLGLVFFRKEQVKQDFVIRF